MNGANVKRFINEKYEMPVGAAGNTYLRADVSWDLWTGTPRIAMPGM